MPDTGASVLVKQEADLHQMVKQEAAKPLPSSHWPERALGSPVKTRSHLILFLLELSIK